MKTAVQAIMLVLRMNKLNNNSDLEIELMCELYIHVFDSS